MSANVTLKSSEPASAEPSTLHKAAAGREGRRLREGVGALHGSASSAQLGLLREFKRRLGDILGGETNFPGESHWVPSKT